MFRLSPCESLNIKFIKNNMKSKDSSIVVMRAEGTSRGVYKEGGGGFNG